MTLKQIFQIKNIPCVYLHDVFKRFLAKVFFDASFMCWFGFIAFRVTLIDLCCWTQRYGLLSRIQLRLTDKSRQTDPNEFVSHFQVVFVVRWWQDMKLGRVVYITVSLLLLKLHKSSSYVRLFMTLKQIFQLESIHCV